MIAYCLGEHVQSQSLSVVEVVKELRCLQPEIVESNHAQESSELGCLCFPGQRQQSAETNWSMKHEHEASRSGVSLLEEPCRYLRPVVSGSGSESQIW